MMNAITSAASASIRSTRFDRHDENVAGESVRLRHVDRDLIDDAERAERVRREKREHLHRASADSDTSTGLSNRRFSPTNAFSMSFADE